MNESVQTIPALRLALAFIPVFAVLAILQAWSHDARDAAYAVARMLVQLLLVGYVLAYIFAAEAPTIILAVLVVMVAVASWIALRPVRTKTAVLYVRAAVAIAVCGGATLTLVTQGVLVLTPWFSPRFLVPLAGMIFASSMNTVSLAAERFEADTGRGSDAATARNDALRAALIPTTNSLLAVGLVSLPGMMTGQILSGISPLVAARYQIMVMCMILGASGLSAACYLASLRPAAASR